MQQLRTALLSTCIMLSMIAPALADGQTQSSTVVNTTLPAASEASTTLNLLYTGEAFYNAIGGIRTGGVYMQNLDAQLNIDTDKAFSWTGGRIYLEAFYATNKSLNVSYVGAEDNQSPIDTSGPTMVRLYQAYYDQKLGNTDLLFGIFDPETEFSNLKPMNLFLNKNFTWNTVLDMSGTMSENGLLGPGNYPYTPLAFRIAQQLTPDVSAHLLISNGAADNPAHPNSNAVQFSSAHGMMAMGELDYTPNKYTKLMAGVWGMTSSLPAYNQFYANGVQRNVYGDEGGYIGATTRLYKGEGHRGLDGFVTIGYGNGDVSSTTRSLNSGLVYTGLLDARPSDKIGLGFNVNGAGGQYKKQMAAQGNGVQIYEPGFELTYRAPINSWLTAQPDVQYIIHPGYTTALKNDLVVGVHFEFGHLFNLD